MNLKLLARTLPYIAIAVIAGAILGYYWQLTPPRTAILIAILIVNAFFWTSWVKRDD